MRIGIMFSGLPTANGADYVALSLGRAVLCRGHELTFIGQPFGPPSTEIPGGLDVVVHSSGYGLTPLLVEQFKRKSKFFVWSHNDEMPQWRSILLSISSMVDRHFSYTRHNNLGSHVVYLPLAADHCIYFKIPDVLKKYDIGMIGCAHPRRVAFANLIRKKISSCFFHFTFSLGDGELNNVYNSTRVVIAPVQDCDSALSKGSVFGCPCRTFEVPSTGAFHLQVYREGLEDIFEKEVVDQTTIQVGYSDDMDLVVDHWVEVIHRWLDESQKRDRIAQRTYELIQEKHLYIHRLDRMLEFM